MANQQVKTGYEVVEYHSHFIFIHLINYFFIHIESHFWVCRAMDGQRLCLSMSQDIIDAMELTHLMQHCQVAPDVLHPKKFTVSILEHQSLYIGTMPYLTYRNVLWKYMIS